MAANFSFNPLALSTAQRVWQNNSSPFLKLGTVPMAALYDVYVKNPYRLTIGNGIALIHSAEQHSLKTKIAVIATITFGAIYTLMLYGTTLHLQGRSFLAFGDKTGSAMLTKIGSSTKQLGMKVFVAGAVPVYGLFYALPRYILLSLPKIAQVTAEKLKWVSHWVFQNLLEPLWRHVILPAKQTAVKWLNIAITKIGAALQTIGNHIANLAKTIFEHVLRLWDQTLLPLLQRMGNTLQNVRTFLTQLGMKIAEKAQWVFQHVITPFWQQTLLPAIKEIGNRIVALANSFSQVMTQIAQSIQSFIQTVIIPFWNQSLLPILQTIRNNIVSLAQSLKQLGAAVAQKVAQSAQWVFEHLLTPLWNYLQPTLQTIGRVLSSVRQNLAPLIQELARMTIQIASFIFNQILIPAIQHISAFLTSAGAFLKSYMINPLNTALMYLSAKTSSIAKAIFDGLLVPAAQATVQITIVIKAALINLQTEIWQTAHSVWNSIAHYF